MATIAENVVNAVMQFTDDPVAPESLFDELGIDSLDYLEISLVLEDTYADAAYLSSHDLGKITTVQDLIDLISSRIV